MFTSRKSIQLWGTRVKDLSRVWTCGHCGAKIYCGRLTVEPPYRCLCGRASWRAVGHTPPADNLL